MRTAETAKPAIPSLRLVPSGAPTSAGAASRPPRTAALPPSSRNTKTVVTPRHTPQITPRGSTQAADTAKLHENPKSTHAPISAVAEARTPRASPSPSRGAAEPKSPRPASTPSPTTSKVSPRKSAKKPKPGRAEFAEKRTYAPADAELDELCRLPSSGQRASATLYRETAVFTHDRHALFTIGWMYWFGLGGCQRDAKKAWLYFQAAALQSHDLALYYSGQMKEKGLLGVFKPNAPVALDYYTHAGELGCDVASYAAGRLLEKIEGAGSANALLQYENAARQGNASAAARLQALRP